MASGSVLSFNLEYDAKAYGYEKAAEIIASTRVSVALLQEASRAAEPISQILGWYSLIFKKSGTAIISSLPIKKISEGSHYGIGKVRDIYYCVIHLSDHPYIPFEAQGIKYPPECPMRGHDRCFSSSNPELLAKRSLTMRKREIREIVVALTGLPVRAKIIAGGDFNEPSHRDWTPEVAAAGMIPFAIKFPATRIMEEMGFVDTFRQAHPHPIMHPGYTWPDRPVEYESTPDRIDFIFTKKIHSKNVDVLPLGVSDHAAIVLHYRGDHPSSR